MPNINKPKTIKKAKKPKVTRSQKPNLPTKTKSTHAYYCCCAEKTKQGIPPGTKITQLTQTCKKQASQLMVAKQKVRETEKKKIIQNWKQIGLSLGKIIDQA